MKAQRLVVLPHCIFSSPTCAPVFSNSRNLTMPVYTAVHTSAMAWLRYGGHYRLCACTTELVDWVDLQTSPNRVDGIDCSDDGLEVASIVVLSCRVVSVCLCVYCVSPAQSVGCVNTVIVKSIVGKVRFREFFAILSGMLSPRDQRGLQIFGLGLVLAQCWPRSHEGCSHGLVVSHRNHVIYVTFFSDRKLLLALV